jgi:hypothetical protein
MQQETHLNSGQFITNSPITNHKHISRIEIKNHVHFHKFFQHRIHELNKNINIFFQSFSVQNQCKNITKKVKKSLQSFFENFLKHSRHGRGVIIKQWYENSKKVCKTQKMNGLKAQTQTQADPGSQGSLWNLRLIQEH